MRKWKTFDKHSPLVKQCLKYGSTEGGCRISGPGGALTPNGTNAQILIRRVFSRTLVTSESTVSLDCSRHFLKTCLHFTMLQFEYALWAPPLPERGASWEVCTHFHSSVTFHLLFMSFWKSNTSLTDLICALNYLRMSYSTADSIPIDYLLHSGIRENKRLENYQTFSTQKPTVKSCLRHEWYQTDEGDFLHESQTQRDRALTQVKLPKPILAVSFFI